MNREAYFKAFREGIIGNDAIIRLPDGKEVPMVYADWTASGRMYNPIEQFMATMVGPLVANTHTETTYSGLAMTKAYHDARDILRESVNAADTDSLIFSGFGMTSAINKLQRLMDLRFPQGYRADWKGRRRPLVLITHMEHHSNQITWEECDVDVLIIPRDEKTGLPDLEWQERVLKENEGKRMLIGAFTAGSNVTGILTDYKKMAALMHIYGGYCFVDFAAVAPYVEIDMHPADPMERLDAITFSPHKFLGGPGSSGVLVMSNELYLRSVPELPGGGTVKWTTPFGTHRYVDSIEAREDGGTPGFLQAIRASLAMKVKASMGIKAILEREEELKELFLVETAKEPSLQLLESLNKHRLGILSFHTGEAHYNLVVKLLNDKFGIQTRGGCSCAGTYGHVLFNIAKADSKKITDLIDAGDLSRKPGWVRVSLHPTMTDYEAVYIGKALVEIIRNYKEWSEEYVFDKSSSEFVSKYYGSSVPALMPTFEGFLPKTS
jgi:selenocysteine lyase/cysteine desulfurase